MKMLNWIQKGEGWGSFILRMILFVFFSFYLWFFLLRDLLSGYFDFSFLNFLKPYIEKQFSESIFSRVGGFFWGVGIYGLWLKSIDAKRNNPALLFPKNSKITNYFFGIGLAFAIFAFIDLTAYFFGIIEFKEVKGTIFLFVVDLIGVWTLSTFTSVTEELICRGYLLNRFSQQMNPQLAVLCQGIIFGFMHLNSRTGFELVLTTSLMGFILGYLFLFTNNLWTCVGMHTGIHLVNVLTSSKFISVEHYHYSFENLFGNNFGGLLGQIVLCVVLGLMIIIFNVTGHRYKSNIMR